MRIGVFGGAFDPPHEGHVALASAARGKLRLDRVLWVPTFGPPHRDGAVAPFADRMEMVRALLGSDPVQAADDIESRLPVPSYTLHTLEALRARHGAAHAWHLLIGSDNWQGFPRWHRPDDVRALARIVVYPRAGYPVDPIPSDVTLLDVPVIPDASTEIRHGLVRDRASTLATLPAPVAEYIRARNLYGERAS